MALALAASAGIVFALHWPYLGLPYFWDELGQFVPAGLDILQHGAWIPRSTVPNSHPPGLMAYLALVWRLFGYSIPATRAAMLVVAAGVVAATYGLAGRLGLRTGFAVLAAALLVADPLFQMQSLLAQLDLPAALMTAVVLVLFLDEAVGWAAAASVALVLIKDTSVVVPLALGAVLLGEGRRKEAAAFVAPLVALGIWFAVLWHATGYVFGSPGYTHYNLTYALHPVRVSVSVLRRLYFLFVADFRWVGAAALVYSMRKTDVFRGRAWRIVLMVSAAQAVLVTALGGAALERYLLPVLPVLYCACAAAFSTISLRWRVPAVAVLGAGLVSGWFLNPAFPFPYENNLALVDFVRLHKEVARYLEQHYAKETIYTAWPLTGALRRPAFGYVDRPMAVRETSDLRARTLLQLAGERPRVLVLYSRTWEPKWGVLRFDWVVRFLTRYYEYGPDLTREEVRNILHLEPAARWERGGQWVEVYGSPGLAEHQSRSGYANPRLNCPVTL
jgi:hypothetical protein